MTAAPQASAFMTWFQEWGPVLYYAAQIVFCIVLSATSVWAASTFKRYVDLRKLEIGAKGTSATGPIAVEEFVD